MKVQNVTITNEAVVIKNDDQFASMLGPNVVLNRCRAVFRESATAFILQGPLDMYDCEIEARKRLVNFNYWLNVRLIRCSLKGTFRSNEFGSWSKGLKQDHQGCVQDCDFSQAILDGVRWWNVDMARVRLPSWPHFTILDPQRLKRELDRADWPGATRHWLQIFSEVTVIEEIAAITIHAPGIVSDRKMACTEAELRKMLNRLGGVIM